MSIKYNLFHYMKQEHGVIMTDGDLNEVFNIVTGNSSKCIAMSPVPLRPDRVPAVFLDRNKPPYRHSKASPPKKRKL